MLKKVVSKNMYGQEAIFFVRPDTSDEEIIDDVRVKNGYFSFGMGEFNKGDTVIDIGGHIGAFAIECAIRGDADVISFEPEPENFDILTRNIDANRLQGLVQVRNKAVSDKTGTMTLYIDEVNPGSHSLSEKYVDHPGIEKIEVETVMLNDITGRMDKIKYLKLDCEGAEYDILMNSDLSKVERIVAELHDRDKTPGLMEHLMLQGFFIKWYFGERMGKLQARRF